MGFKKKDKVEEARKIIEEAEKLEALKQEQAITVPVVQTVPKIEPAAPAPSKEEIAQIEEQVNYFNNNYRGIFNPTEMPAQTQNPMLAEIASLLFGILQELRKK